MYRYIEPEVAGGLGKETIINSSFHPPLIEKLHYEFNGWLGDDILESFPCYIVTERLKNKIESNNLTGVKFDQVTITKSEEFKTLYSDKELPKFYWAKINGELYVDDFVIGQDYRLLISENAFQILKLFNTSNALFEDSNASN